MDVQSYNRSINQPSISPHIYVWDRKTNHSIHFQPLQRFYTTMSHSKCKIWVHAVFSTKDRQPLIQPLIRPAIHLELRNQLVAMNCFVDCIGGIADHVHILFLLNPNKSIADVVKQIKGGSSHAFNQVKLTATHFAWQIGYGAFSVSESHVSRVRRYIQNQEEHHRKITFLDEFRRFMDHYGLPVENIV